MSLRCLTEKIKAEADSLGFFACGVAKAEPVDAVTADGYRRWIAAGHHASMHYLADNIDKRLNPRLLVDNVKSIVCLALSYCPEKKMPDDQYQIACYAYGKDYHDIMKRKLHALAAQCGFTDYRAFCDTAPVLERYWAQKAGLGWIGRNRQLIIPHAGSLFFLGELFLPVELEYDTPARNCCGTCHACIDACPTKALTSDSPSPIPNPCLSYLTIEHRGEFTEEERMAVQLSQNYIYGCDRCQQVCPWNRFAAPTQESELQPSAALLSMTKEAWHNLTEEQYRQLFKGSAVKRAKYDGLRRNITVLALS